MKWLLIRTLPSQTRRSFYLMSILYSWWVALAWAFLYSKLRSSHCSIPKLGNVIVPKNILLAILIGINPIFRRETDIFSKKQEKNKHKSKSKSFQLWEKLLAFSFPLSNQLSC